jgi:hypothetical protein
VRSVVNKVPVGKAFLSKGCGSSLPNINITVMPHINLSSGARKICSHLSPQYQGALSYFTPCTTIHIDVWNVSGIHNTQHPEMQSLKSFTPLSHPWSCIPATGPSGVQRVNTTLCEIRKEWWSGKYPITMHAKFLLHRKQSVHQGIFIASSHPCFETILSQMHKYFLACFFSDSNAQCPFKVSQHSSYNGVSWHMLALHVTKVLWSETKKNGTHVTTGINSSSIMCCQLMKGVFWGVTPCSSIDSYCAEEYYCSIFRVEE